MDYTMMWVLQDWRRIMRRALMTGLLAFGTVFIAGVLFGWPYGLLIGFVILLINVFLTKRGG